MSDPAAIREATLDLLTTWPPEFPWAETVAVRAGVSTGDVEAIYVDEAVAYRFILEPLVEAIDEEVRELPVHRNPTAGQQRAALAATLRACLLYPRQVKLLHNMLGRDQSVQRQEILDGIAYQSLLRLIGSDHGEDPDYVRRAFLLSEFLGSALVSHRNNMEDPDDFNAVIASGMGILHPPDLDYSDSPSRRN